RRGYQNKHIAAELKLAESTVKAHVTEILRKLKLFSRNKAVIEIGKISLPVPKKRGSNKGESAFPESGDHKPAEMGGMAKR
ncbi:response regulator transcription factor, partial [Streptomyces scabiei]|uniref:response regulator transcription factor n=3 Tax=Bacteria TaxID=2 RepID=UPI0038F72B55